MAEGVRIFVSSTSDLRVERDALNRRLSRNHRPWFYEHEGAGGDPPEQHCLDMIRDSDVFVGVLGPRYGSLHPDLDISIVEWEFERAGEEDGLEVMAFPKVSADDQSVETKQRRFLRQLGSFVTGRWIKMFRTEDDLVAVVSDSLEKWLIRRVSALNERVRRGRRRIRTGLVVGIVSLLILLLVGGVLAITGWLSMRAGLCLLLSLGVVIGIAAIVRWGMEEGDDDD